MDGWRQGSAAFLGKFFQLMRLTDEVIEVEECKTYYTFVKSGIFHWPSINTDAVGHQFTIKDCSDLLVRGRGGGMVLL